jgi:hypothetical protein
MTFPYMHIMYPRVVMSDSHENFSTLNTTQFSNQSRRQTGMQMSKVTRLTGLTFNMFNMFELCFFFPLCLLGRHSTT